MNMAGEFLIPMDQLLSTRVQDMVINGEQPRQQYICREDGGEYHDITFPVAQTPHVDLSLLSSLTPSSEQQQELLKLKSALSSWGCFQAIKHGIASSSLDMIRQVAREFFEQPMDVKRKYAKGVEEFQGYGADPVPEEGQFLDWSDRLSLDVYPEDLRKPKFWPETPSSFREVLEDYTVKMKMITRVVSRAMERALDLEENCFLNQFGEQAVLNARFNNYSCCQRPDLVLGLKPHSDASGYTIILQDEVEGLQVLKDEKWFTVPTVPDALLILMGDQMEIMSNGEFKSPVHRVLTNSERERISIAVFYNPETKKEIGPAEGLVNEERPKLYRDVKNYDDTYWEYYQKGMRAIHTAKV